MRNHRLRDKDLVAKTATCVICGPVDLVVYAHSWCCVNSVRYSVAISRIRQRKSMPPKETYCEACGFVADHPCQLEQDVMFGKNASKNNVWTLCANCLALKLYHPDVFMAQFEVSRC